MTTETPSVPAISDLVERLFTAGRRIAVAEGLDDVLLAVVEGLRGSSGRRTKKLSAHRIDYVMVLKAEMGSPRTLTVLSGWAASPALALEAGASFMMVSGLVLDMLAEGQTLIVDDVRELDTDLRFDEVNRAGLANSGLVSLILAPLTVARHWFGAIVLGSTERAIFSPTEVRAYQILIEQAGLALACHMGILSQKTAPEMDAQGCIEQFGQLTLNAGYSLIVTDLDRQIKSFNAAAEDLYGYTLDQVIDQPLSLLIPPKRRIEDSMWANEVAQDCHPVNGETERVARSGRIIPVLIALWPLKDPQDNVIGIAEITIDRGKQILIESNLQRERELYEAILESANDAIIMVNTARLVVTANLQFETFFRMPRYGLAHQSIEKLAAMIQEREDLPDEFGNILLTFAGDTTQTAAGDFELSGDEPRVLVWYTSPVHANDGGLLGRLFAYRDATREREADKMKTEFVSLVSHELRTPLTSVKGFTEFILDGDAGPLDSGVREYLQIVNFNTDRLISLVNDILDITRLEAGRVQLHRAVCSVQELVSLSIQIVAPMIGERQQSLTIAIEPRLPIVQVDHDRMTQIITNLLSNASKYSPNGGTIKIEAYRIDSLTALAQEAPESLRLPAIMIGLHDTGMGIAPQDQALIFNRFFRTEQATRNQIAGTGLGLTIVKSFVELHGGSVWLHSELGRGSSFYFTIPILEEDV